MAGIVEISGIGDIYAEKLRANGIRTTEALLEAGATAKGRSDLEAATGISGKLILGWVNKADLSRIKGIGTEYSDLLEAAGVDTVVELSNRRADHLAAKLAEVNQEYKFVHHLPSEAQVGAWIAEAKALPRVMTY
jgi:predicted flap endonuclease-1-like 5' DNA nuclease